MTDMQDIIGQAHAKRALEVAAAGGHHVFLVGPTGAGKTMLANALWGIMPGLTQEIRQEIASIAGTDGHVPFRAPAHNVIPAMLVGGGNVRVPEAALAHRGLLLMDDLPLFPQGVLVALREVLDQRKVGPYPAAFILVATANPCPCGYFGDPVKECTCSLSMVSRYQKRVPEPLLDRIDIHIEVPRVDYEKLSSDRLGEPSAAIRKRVEAAREIQRWRFEGTGLTCNADMGPAEIRQYCDVDQAGKSLLRAAMQQLSMSARAYHHILKLARTIADLAGSERIETAHLAEAIQYRPPRGWAR